MTNVMVNGQGDNKVHLEDISLLGAHYGQSGAALTGFEYLDVGPTTNNYVTGRPTTDLLLNFEDFILYAINYGVVSGPSRMEPLASTQSVVLSMTVGSSAPARAMAHLILSGWVALAGLAAT